MFSHRPVQIYGGKAHELYENRTEGMQVIRVPNGTVKN